MYEIRDNYGNKIGEITGGPAYYPGPIDPSAPKPSLASKLLFPFVLLTAILIYWGHGYASHYETLRGLYRYVAQYYYFLGVALLYLIKFLMWLVDHFNVSARPNLNFVLMCASLLLVAFAIYWPIRFAIKRSSKVGLAIAILIYGPLMLVPIWAALLWLFARA